MKQRANHKTSMVDSQEHETKVSDTGKIPSLQEQNLVVISDAHVPSADNESSQHPRCPKTGGPRILGA
eukprot:1269816-Amphidinium_carterae.1